MRPPRYAYLEFTVENDKARLDHLIPEAVLFLIQVAADLRASIISKTSTG
ncbi:MAG: hypothetical protein OSB19_14585 [Opitutaceae bacterium]|nr:hypothetical protein [Opitutaceae bacterium]